MMAGNVPELLFAIRTPLLSTTPDDMLDNAGATTDDETTVPGSVNTMLEPALNVPAVTVTVSTPPATPAAAAGEPDPAEVKATVFADKLCGALPPRVIRNELPVGMVASGVNETVMVTELAFFATLLSVMVGAFVPNTPLTIATILPVLLDSIIVLVLLTNAD